MATFAIAVVAVAALLGSLFGAVLHTTLASNFADTGPIGGHVVSRCGGVGLAPRRLTLTVYGARSQNASPGR
jgi:hypothetical protein